MDLLQVVGHEHPVDGQTELTARRFYVIDVPVILGCVYGIHVEVLPGILFRRITALGHVLEVLLVILFIDLGQSPYIVVEPVGDLDDILIGGVDGIGVDVPGDGLDFLVWICNLDTHRLVGLDVPLPNLRSPEVDESLGVEDGVLSLLGDRLGDDRVVEVEAGESESAVDTVDDDLGSELEVVVDVGLGLAVCHDILDLACLPTLEPVLGQVVLDLLFRRTGMDHILEVVVYLGELEGSLLVFLSLEVEVCDNLFEDTVLLLEDGAGSADDITLLPPFLLGLLVMLGKDGHQGLRTDVELSHQGRIQGGVVITGAVFPQARDGLLDESALILLAFLLLGEGIHTQDRPMVFLESGTQKVLRDIGGGETVHRLDSTQPGGGQTAGQGITGLMDELDQTAVDSIVEDILLEVIVKHIIQ